MKTFKKNVGEEAMRVVMKVVKDKEELCKSRISILMHRVGCHSA
jgi:hypothetical protein